MGSRGCPFNCSNCSNHSLRQLYPNPGRYVRQRSARNVIAEIDACRSRFSFEAVTFEDDTFTINRHWLAEFCSLYRKEVSLPFRCNVRPETATPENMRMLNEAGCECVSIGVESGDEKIRKSVLRRDMPDSLIIKAFRNAKAAKLKVRSFNMVGLPYETRLSLLRTILLNARLAPHQVQTTIYYPFKGTDLGELCYRNNWVNKGREEKTAVLSNDSVLDLPGLTRREIILAKWLNSMTALLSGNPEIIRLGLLMVFCSLWRKIRSLFLRGKS
jgi:radical SAM superfamily enzyme YgiQ (UPF0313 family)